MRLSPPAPSSHVLSLVLAFGACGDTDDPSSADTTTSASTGEQTTSETLTSTDAMTSSSTSSSSSSSAESTSSSSGTDDGGSTDSGSETDSSCVLVLDDFERADLGPDWTVYNGSPHIVAASDLGADQGLNIATWTARAFPDDQYAEGVLSDPLDARNAMIFVRRRASDLQRYGFVWVGSDYAPCQALDPGWSAGPGGVLLKLDGGPDAPTLVCAQRPPVGGGDVLRVEVEGTTLRGFVNGELLAEAVDAEIQGGEPGVALVGDGEDQAAFESFEAGCVQ